MTTNAPTTTQTTVMAVSVDSLTSATVTLSDGSKKTFAPNPILDLAANKSVPIAMLHAALRAYLAENTQAATDAASAAIELTHTQLATLLANGTSADIAAAKSVLATAMLPARQKKIAAAQAKLAKAQAELTAAQTGS